MQIQSGLYTSRSTFEPSGFHSYFPISRRELDRRNQFFTPLWPSQSAIGWVTTVAFKQSKGKKAFVGRESKEKTKLKLGWRRCGRWRGSVLSDLWKTFLPLHRKIERSVGGATAFTLCSCELYCCHLWPWIGLTAITKRDQAIYKSGPTGWGRTTEGGVYWAQWDQLTGGKLFWAFMHTSRTELQKVTDNSLAKQIRALKLSLVQRDHRKMKDFLFSTHFPNSSALKINNFFSKLDGSATYTWVWQNSVYYFLFF